VKKFLFVCVENAGRSQMAETFATHYGKGKIESTSAGTLPSNQVSQVVVQAMREKGIDLSSHRPKLLTAMMIEEADVVVVMGCGAEGFCPAP
jgi:arsenate reductase